jgi:two-component system chemotaxis response regulator CheB
LSSDGKTRVLITDDSAFMRKVLSSILSADPQLDVVGEARDGREAVSLNDSLKPDVITMDINMPHMDGMQATEVIMSTNPRPIVIVSSESREGAGITLRALELGAIDFVAKPSSGVDLDMSSVRDELCRKVKTAAKVRVVRNASRAKAAGASGEAGPAAGGNGAVRAANPPPETISASPASAMPKPNGRFPIVVVAASTGGPATLMRFVPAFPKDFPGAVLLVQHMPGTFTAQFSQQLAEASSIRVKEAEPGEIVQPGILYVCPGSHHLRISPTGRITLDDGPRISGYRPCADVTMETAAAFAGPMTIGVVLTGMGSDGARGAQLVKSAGGHVIAQDEASSVIFGMPAETIKTGAADQVLNIDAIYPAIEKRVLYIHGASRVGAL